MQDAEHYLARAMELGATDAVRFAVDELAFDHRTILKCMFGCDDWGKGPTCPSRPGSLMPWEYEPLLRRYSWGIIIHSHEKKTAHEVSLSLEREAYLDGYYLAFSLSDCAECDSCAGLAGGPCANPKMARPAFHSVGIDVFKTVRYFDLPIEPLRDSGDQQNWYAAVFIK